MKRTSVSLSLAASLLFAGGCGGGSESVVADGVTPESDTPGSGTEEEVAATPPAADEPVPGNDDSPFTVDAPDPPSGTPEGTLEPPSGDEDTGQAPPMGDDGPEGRAPVGESEDTDALVGWWDYTRATNAGTDVVLFSIEAGGIVTEYDYLGDAVGDGRDCHVVSTASIVSRGDARYDIQDSSTLPGSNGMDDVLITVENDEITFRYIGDVFDPEFGDGQAGVTEIYPAVTDRRPEELALCDDL